MFTINKQPITEVKLYKANDLSSGWFVKIANSSFSECPVYLVLPGRRMMEFGGHNHGMVIGMLDDDEFKRLESSGELTFRVAHQ